MNPIMEPQILITRSVLHAINDIHHFKERITFPHINRTGLSLTQVFDLLTAMDPLIPYYVRNCTVTTTTDEKENWEWTLLLTYTSVNRDEIRGWYREVQESLTFLKRHLFREGMPDYVKVYRACAFLAGSLTYDQDLSANPHLGSPYGAFIKSRCSDKGYAYALRELLDAAEIPNMVISGSINQEASFIPSDRYERDTRTHTTCHYWNLVGIETTDGIKYFHVDLSWDQREKDLAFQWFLKDDATMQKTRKWDFDSFPPCTFLPGEDIEALVKADYN